MKICETCGANLTPPPPPQVYFVHDEELGWLEETNLDRFVKFMKNDGRPYHKVYCECKDPWKRGQVVVIASGLAPTWELHFGSTILKYKKRQTAIIKAESMFRSLKKDHEAKTK